MIKGSVLEFHKTFSAETGYVAKILQLAIEKTSGTKDELSKISGIPTGKTSGKVIPHIKYAAYMGLIDYDVDGRGVYTLSATKLGEEIFMQDPFLHEVLSLWLCHYGMCRRNAGAPQWEYLIHNVHPGFGEVVDQDRIFAQAQTWCDVSLENMLKKVFGAIKGCYARACFENLQFLSWDEDLEFLEQSEQFDMVFVYAYALLESWDRLFPSKQEITDFDIKDEIGFGRIFGLNEDEYNYVMDSLAYEGIISINRQMYPASIIRTASVESIIPQIYSRVL